MMSHNLTENDTKKGFISYFKQDHCYLEERQDSNPKHIETTEEILRNYDQTETYNLSPIKQINKNGHIMKSQETQKKPKIGIQQIIYLPPVGYCTEHEDLLLHEDQRLVKPGDKFKTHNDFVQYLNENAKRWFYYYKCSDSRKPNTEQEMYLYTCVYLRNKEKYVKKGLRKRNNSLKTNCPCKIKLRHLPYENELTVVFVCNHHDHPLSEEAFYKLQHGRRLPPYIKEEIMDLLTLKVGMGKIRKYVQNATGFNMSRAFFYTIERSLKSRNVTRQISDERIRILSKRLNENNIFDSIENKRYKSNDSEENVNSETLQSVKNLQDSVKCETQHNPWVTDQCVPALPNGDITIISKDNIMSGVENHKDEDNIEMTDVVQNNHEMKCDVNNTFETIEDCGTAYETFVSRTDNEYDENVISEYIYDDAEEYNGAIGEGNNEDGVKDTNGAINCEYEIIEYENDAEIVEYFADNGDECINNCIEEDNSVSNDYCEEEIVEYGVDYDSAAYIEAKDAEVQTCDNINKINPLLSVFDVCMKDGNVTGFVVNNEVMKQLKNDCVEKAVQTEEINNSQAEDFSNTEAKDYTEQISDGTYIKHEFIHKYNIDKYMSRPCFPKYIEVLSKKTGIDVLKMFTNVYNERAIFKMTTTQNNKEGNTRILYVTNPQKIPRLMNTNRRKQLDNCLKEIVALKERVRALEMKNLKLESINNELVTSLR